MCLWSHPLSAPSQQVVLSSFVWLLLLLLLTMQISITYCPGLLSQPWREGLEPFAQGQWSMFGWLSRQISLFKICFLSIFLNGFMANFHSFSVLPDFLYPSFQSLWDRNLLCSPGLVLAVYLRVAFNSWHPSYSAFEYWNGRNAPTPGSFSAYTSFLSYRSQNLKEEEGIYIVWVSCELFMARKVITHLRTSNRSFERLTYLLPTKWPSFPKSIVLCWSDETRCKEDDRAESFT